MSLFHALLMEGVADTAVAVMAAVDGTEAMAAVDGTEVMAVDGTEGVHWGGYGYPYGGYAYPYSYGYWATQCDYYGRCYRVWVP